MKDCAFRKSVLIADDEEDLTWSISKTLERNDRHLEVICVPDGNRALEVLAQRPIDIVVSDIRMPGRDGLQLLEDIRRDYPATKVIIMTAHGSGDMREEIESRGTKYYLEKPFELRYLRKLIYEALELMPPFFPEVMDSNATFTLRGDGFNAGASSSLAPSPLRDTIESHCRSRKTSAMIVRHGPASGVIHFNNGDIVHAECGNLIGENAFYNILRWKTGRVSLNPLASPGKRTIAKEWRSLLDITYD